MASENKCKSCLFFDDGCCRCNPPQVVGLVPKYSPLSNKTVNVVLCAFPNTSESDWCGKFENGRKLVLS